MLTNTIEFNPVQLLLNLSRSFDFTTKGLLKNHKKTALLSLLIAGEAGLSEEDIILLFKSAIIHDIGAIRAEEKTSLHIFDTTDTEELHSQRKMIEKRTKYL